MQQKKRKLRVYGQCGRAGNLATYCARAGARMVQISTDYVFAGDAHEPYAENAHAQPVTAYGTHQIRR